MASHTLLSDKFDDALGDGIARYAYPDISAQVKKFAAPRTKGVDLMLRKGRRLTEQTLDACQMKRTKCVPHPVSVV